MVAKVETNTGECLSITCVLTTLVALGFVFFAPAYWVLYLPHTPVETNCVIRSQTYTQDSCVKRTLCHCASGCDSDYHCDDLERDNTTLGLLSLSCCGQPCRFCYSRRRCVNTFDTCIAKRGTCHRFEAEYNMDGSSLVLYVECPFGDRQCPLFYQQLLVGKDSFKCYYRPVNPDHMFLSEPGRDQQVRGSIAMMFIAAFFCWTPALIMFMTLLFDCLCYGCPVVSPNEQTKSGEQHQQTDASPPSPVSGRSTPRRTSSFSSHGSAV